MTAVDTSVLIAAFSSWHEYHHVAVRACHEDPLLPTHAYIEAYAVLTRMPGPFRAEASVVAEYLHRRWSHRLIVPSESIVVGMPLSMRRAGLTGGTTHDALIALTAQEVDTTLISLDRRARRTYASLGIKHRLLV